MHWATALLVAMVLHMELCRRHSASLRDEEFLMEPDNDEDEFPQRLGLRY